jgi:hypothetical protein
MTFEGARSGRRSEIRCGACLCILMLLFAPLTRATQRLEVASPVSGAPGFSKNVDLPPKKVAVAPLPTLVTVVVLAVDDRVCAPDPSPLPDANPLRSPDLSPSRPLRAPPSTHIA